jgi:hypothetical protein
MRVFKRRYVTAVAVAAVGLTVTGGWAIASSMGRPVPAGQETPPASAPGLAHMIAASHLAAAVPTPDVRTFVSEVARGNAGNATEALTSLRLLEAGVGTAHLNLYFYDLGNGVPCFVVIGMAGACQVDETTTPGVSWIISGARTLADGTVRPTAIYGLADDRVRAIDFLAGGVTTQVHIVNNSFFFEVPTNDAAATGPQLQVTYADNSQKTAPVPLGD